MVSFPNSEVSNTFRVIKLSVQPVFIISERIKLTCDVHKKCMKGLMPFPADFANLKEVKEFVYRPERNREIRSDHFYQYFVDKACNIYTSTVGDLFFKVGSYERITDTFLTYTLLDKPILVGKVDVDNYELSWDDEITINFLRDDNF